MAGPSSGGLVEDAGDGVDEAAPLRGLHGEPLAPGLREAVELHAPLGLREPPLGLDPAVPLQPVERRVERPLLDAEDVGAHPLDPPGDGVPVSGPPGERLEDQRVEGAVEQLGRLGHGADGVAGSYA
jgi:hypothetical protein